MLPDDPEKPPPDAVPKVAEPDHGEGLADVFREIESDDKPDKKLDEPPA